VVLLLKNLWFDEVLAVFVNWSSARDHGASYGRGHLRHTFGGIILSK